MYGAFIGHIEFRNPPWVDFDIDFSCVNMVDVPEPMLANQVWADALRKKLASIDTSQSVELKRFVTLTTHELGHHKISWLEPESPKPQLYDAYGIPTSFRLPQTISSIIGRVMEEQFQILQSGIHCHFRKLLLLDLVFKLIDRVVEYWNEVSLARRAWISFSGAFRQFLEGALQFKPFHTPLRLFPSSIHPIGSAA